MIFSGGWLRTCCKFISCWKTRHMMNVERCTEYYLYCYRYIEIFIQPNLWYSTIWSTEELTVGLNLPPGKVTIVKQTGIDWLPFKIMNCADDKFRPAVSSQLNKVLNINVNVLGNSINTSLESWPNWDTALLNSEELKYARKIHSPHLKLLEIFLD